MQVEKLIDDGYDVRGYYYWTLVDNFEVRSFSYYHYRFSFSLRYLLCWSFLKSSMASHA